MTEQLRQQLKTLIITFVEQKNDLKICVDKIIELFRENGERCPTTNEQQGERRRSIFDDVPTPPSGSAQQSRRSSTYNEQGLVNNPNTVLYDNRDFD
jgi:hypothetical protein